MDSSFIFYKSVKYADKYRVRFSKMEHHFFGSVSQRFYNSANEKDRVNLEERNYCYKIMCKYTLNFLNATIKDSKKSIKWLSKTPEKHNISIDFLSIEFKAGIK